MISQFSHVLGIMNPKAGVRHNMQPRVVAACEKLGINFRLELTQYPGHATELAEDALQGGFDLVVAIGGDGTINEVGRALVGTDVPMGVVPAGSGNAFARALGLSFDPAKACEAFVQPQICKLDAGRVGDVIFFSAAGLGIDAEVVRGYAARTGRRGLLPYVVLTVQTLRTFRPESMFLVLDSGSEIERCPLLVAVANIAQYGSGVTIAPHAVPNDGLFDVCVVTHPGWVRLALNAYRLFTGTINRMPGVEMFRAKKVCIRRQAEGWFQFDGEAQKGDKTLEFEILAGALKLVLPKRSEA
ncbi:MAG: diacylglycerol kinase family lipid kinase [Candidatus Latescibacteria bacterium]|jgi:YegS/Rv2252/BmrU family lipid kinase|nr:diacylglycerol kinase family lipid kinase [Candidatus Latescibacterota bacterium]